MNNILLIQHEKQKNTKNYDYYISNIYTANQPYNSDNPEVADIC